ncbi:MAG: AraC family transcriptional regulator [Bacteroidota bacterium]
MKSNAFQVLPGEGSNNYIVRSSLQCYSSKKTEENYTLKYVNSGTESYYVDGKRHQLSNRQFLMINPGQEVVIEIDAANQVEGNCFFFDPAIMDHVYSSEQSSNRSLKSMFFDTISMHGFGTALDPLLGDHLLVSLEQPAEVTDFLILLSENLVKHQLELTAQKNHLEGKSEVTRLEIVRSIERGRAYIHDCFDREIQLEDIALAANMSSYYFHRSFRSYFGKTPHQYLSNLRLNKAREIIRSETCTLSEVAYRCGFTDPKYFSKRYKKWQQGQG